MYRHTPARLRGPISRTRAWWKFSAPEPKPAVDGSRKRRAVGGPAAAREVRAELVARVRREIAEGRYDTQEKWDAALENLFARLE